jgi:hypothetical protein
VIENMVQQDDWEKAIQGVDFNDKLDSRDSTLSDMYRDQTWPHKREKKASAHRRV